MQIVCVNVCIQQHRSEIIFHHHVTPGLNETNARSMGNKQEGLEALVKHENCDVVAIRNVMG